MNLDRAAIRYHSDIHYGAKKLVAIGEISIVCPYCHVLIRSGESTGLCCAREKKKLPQLVLPPDPLCSLVSVIGSDSNHFLANIHWQSVADNGRSDVIKLKGQDDYVNSRSIVSNSQIFYKAYEAHINVE